MWVLQNKNYTVKISIGPADSESSRTPGWPSGWGHSHLAGTKNTKLIFSNPHHNPEVNIKEFKIHTTLETISGFFITKKRNFHKKL